MRENRSSGSEGGVALIPAIPTPITGWALTDAPGFLGEALDCGSLPTQPAASLALG
jgi:hypothetical protein